MFLTYEQSEYIRKQYLQYVKGKITAEKASNRIQKKLKVNKDLTEIIKECKNYNKGYYDIGWELAEV